ncbi:class I SAM-dependent methyltransferase [Saccharopolyspora sp. K220]|uniref:class I SAM-dependent methyltransferase n=1 Tax=Saccharopolyspora soli TaxID=2926618 RepID=UPI001F56B165|nr:class I SAM-dependent methyltransferase [Saccharopolyspora soli]MCI2422909.1 class I SAM-dependent methyltransferase [Saccharopolyspora soli]
MNGPRSRTRPEATQPGETQLRDQLANYTARTGIPPAADITGTAAPASLLNALTPPAAVTEFPARGGHFLYAYAQAGFQVILVDEDPELLRIAVARARQAGISAARLDAVRVAAPAVPDLRAADLVVVPSGELNRMAAARPVYEVLRALRHAMSPGARLIAQVLCHGNPGPWHDPTRSPMAWCQDHAFTDLSGERVVRWRRYDQRGDLVWVDYRYTSAGGRKSETYPMAHLKLRLFTDLLRAETRLAGFTDVTLAAGHGTYSELAATVPANRSQDPG